MKRITINKFHIILIFVGIIFNAIGIFHTNLWFDESYSVGMAKFNFQDIWNIGGHDVHPVLYYWVLHLIKILVGENIIVYRAFSLICISALGILGYTHIRKDFGEKVGILFTFFSYFLPSICVFANEIRMYSLAALLITIAAIYGYRIYLGKEALKNWIIFEITILGCIYVHYYGLIAAGLINLFMLINFIKNKRNKTYKKLILFGIIQLILYIPWILYFVLQLKHVAKGFWIGFEFPDTVIELLSYQYIGNIKNYYIGFGVSILLYIYIIIKMYKLNKNKENILLAKLAISLYFSVIAIAIVVTIFAKTSILHYRYLFAITGLYIFAISFILSKEQNNKIVILICAITAILAVASNKSLIENNYSKTNTELIEYLKDNVNKEDVLIYENVDVGATLAIYLKNNLQYFYNEENWQIEEAYKAFSPQMKIYTEKNFINNLSGRIWIIDGFKDQTYQKLFNNDEYKFLMQESFETKYKGYIYTITLVTKNE